MFGAAVLIAAIANVKIKNKVEKEIEFCDKFIELNTNKVYQFLDTITYKKDYDRLKQMFMLKHNKMVVDVDDVEFKRRDFIFITHYVDNRTLDIIETDLYKSIGKTIKQGE